MENNKKGFSRIKTNLFFVPVLMAVFFVSMMGSAFAFEVSSQTTYQSTCPGSTVLFTAVLKGTGDFTINLDGKASSWASAVPQGVQLDGESETIYVYATPPSNTPAGLYDLNLKISSSDSTRIVQYTVDVTNCHKLEIAGEMSKSMCACQSGAYNFVLKNTGTFQEIYSLGLKGVASEYMSLSQDRVMLNPGEEKFVSASVKVPCDRTGKDVFTLTAGSENVFKEINGDVSIRDCFGFNVKTEKDYFSFCEHTINSIPITIENSADISNKMTLVVTGPAWTNLDKRELELDTRSRGYVNLIINPDYGISGDFDVKVIATEQRNKIPKEKNLKINVRDCYSVDVEVVESEERICSGFTKGLTAEVKNNGDYAQEYKIASNQNFAVPSTSLVKLESGQKAVINLTVSPTAEVALKEYDLVLSASASDGSKTSDSDVSKVTVLSKKQCYEPEISVDDVKVKVDSSATAKVTVRNIGSEKSEYTAMISGSAVGFTQINPAVLSINPEKSKTTYLYVAPGLRTVPGEYELLVSLKLSDGEVIGTRNIKISVVGSGSEVTGVVTGEVEKKEGLWTRMKGWFSNVFKREKEEEKVTDFSEETTVSRDMEFVFDGKIYKMELKDISRSKVTVQIEEIMAIINFGAEKKIDINEDGVYDLKLVYYKIANQTAFLNALKISERTAPLVEDGEKEAEEEKETLGESSSSGMKEKFLAYKYPIIAGVIVFFILVILIAKAVKKDEDETFEEEFNDDFDKGFEDEDGEEIKIGRWIVGIIALVVLFVLARKWWADISVYKYYILIGLVLLAILILAIKYWGRIIDFFEEEEEEGFEEEEKTPGYESLSGTLGETQKKTPARKEASPAKKKRGRPPKNR
jgi:hypothetical protein